MPGPHKWLALGVLALAYVWAGADAYDGWYNGQWFQVGRQPLPPMYQGLQAHLLTNTHVNDVILSNNELSFALNGISGRKVMISRRSQNDPFMDFDQRQLDAAIILYGDNTERKRELLQRYSVDYMYFDFNWFSLDYPIDPEGRIVGYADPIMLIYSAEKERALSENGIAYIKVHGWIDPAMRGDEFRTYDLLLVSPENYDNGGKGPWKDDIDAWLEPVWSASDGQNTVAVLYRINAN